MVYTGNYTELAVAIIYVLFELKCVGLHLDDSSKFLNVCECLASYSKLCMVENIYVGFGRISGVLGSSIPSSRSILSLIFMEIP